MPGGEGAVFCAGVAAAPCCALTLPCCALTLPASPSAGGSALPLVIKSAPIPETRLTELHRVIQETACAGLGSRHG